MHSRVKKGLVAALMAMVLLIPFAGASAAGPMVAYTFTSFDFPDAIVTQAYGINPGGDIVGTYQLPTDAPSTVWPGMKQAHGFLLKKNGEFITLNYPSGEGKITDYTIATAISPDGDIVGYYASRNELPKTAAHGFLLNKHGEWSTYSHPLPATDFGGDLAMTPSPMRIMPDGRTVG